MRRRKYLKSEGSPGSGSHPSGIRIDRIGSRSDPHLADDTPPTEADRPPLFHTPPFADEKTPAPKKAEWDAAPRVTADPRAPERPCEARRLREWVRIRCTSGSFGAIRILGGKRDGLQTSLLDYQDDFVPVAGTAELVIPVRRGDARVIEVMSIDFGYKGSTSVAPWMVVSEHWPEEDESPTISML